MEKTNIKKLLLSMAFVAAVAPSVQAQTQSVSEQLENGGYFRIQNGIGVSTNDHYVVQSDLLYAAPNLTEEQAKTNAGSVFYIQASPVTNMVGMPAGTLRINQLRSQGVELIGDKLDGEGNPTYEDWKAYWNAPYSNLLNDEDNDLTSHDTRIARYRAWREAGQLGYLRIARALIESFIYNTAVGLTKAGLQGVDATEQKNITDVTEQFNNELANDLDIDAYLVPTDASATSYYIKWRPIDWKRVADFFSRTEVMAKFQSGLKAMEKYMTSGQSGETLDDNEVPAYMKLGYDVFKDAQDATDYGINHGTYPVNWYRDAPEGTTFAKLPVTGGGSCHISYECIFTHPYLLYGWVKLHLYKMMHEPSGYTRPIDEFGGKQLYNLLESLGKDQTFLSYFSRYPYYDSRDNKSYKDIYLIDGFLSENGTLDTENNTSDETVPGNTYKPLGRFGFRVQNVRTLTTGDVTVPYDDYSTYKSIYDNEGSFTANPTGTTYAQNQKYYQDTYLASYKKHLDGSIANAGEGAKWVITPVSGDDAFYFKPYKQGLDGNYYTSLCVDFPIDVAASAPLKFWTIGGEVKSAVLNNKPYRYVDVSEVTTVVPKGQAVIIESPVSEDNIATKLVPAKGQESLAPTESLLHGVYFNVGKTNATTDNADNVADFSKKVENKLANVFDYDHGFNGEPLTGLKRLEAELTNRYDIAFDADDNVLYTFQLNATDTHNPMGFYHYNGTTLNANKVFMIQPASSGAKINIGAPDGETTGINGVVADEDNKPVVIYDLAGRRVSEPTQGIYIINGKKVLITK